MKVGDKVRVLGIFGEEKISEEYVGKIGTIRNIEDGEDYPYDVTFVNHDSSNFNEEELEVISNEEELEVKFEDGGYPPLGAIVKVNNDYYITDLKGLTGKVVTNDGGVAFVVMNDLNGLHSLSGLLSSPSGRYFTNDDVDIVYYPELNKKQENMNEEIERAIREGEQAMKLAKTEEYGSKSTTLSSYVGDVKPTLGNLRKRFKVVGFISTSLKSTI